MGRSMKRIAVLMLGLTLSVNAEAGKRGSESQFGLGASVGSVSIDDPDGSTGSSFVIYPTFLYLLNVSRDTRFVSDLLYLSYSLDASQSEIGQKVASLSISGVYEWKKRVSRDFKPWIGVGLGYGSNSSKNRHTVDADGFLDDSFADRNSSGVSVILDVSTDINLNHTNMLLRGNFTVPTYKGPGGFNLSLNYLF